MLSLNSIMKEYLESINKTKSNIIRNSGAMETADSLYGKDHFIVMRSLSYHIDSILLVNELNTRGLESFGISNTQKFEFLLNVLPKKNRFSKWGKVEKDDLVVMIMEKYNYNYERAKEASLILSESQRAEMMKVKQHGGIGKK
jgi:hypothetical protein